MTAMMVLFLVVMVASLSSVTQRIQRAEQGEKTRGQDISRLCERLELHARNVNKTIVVDCHDNRISFGEAGRFDHNRFFLNAEGQKALQDVVPLVLMQPTVKRVRSGSSKSLLKGLPTLMAHICTTYISPYNALNGSCVACSIAAAHCKKVFPQNNRSKSVNFSLQGSLLQ
jgi:hypothetical protein